MLEVFRRLGSIQFDPLAVAGRNHDLVLHARVAGYDPAWCEQLLYHRRQLFEAYNKGFSLLPTSELPWYRVTWSLNSPRILAEHADVAEPVLERIRAEGPLSTLDFERGPTVDWFWAPTNVVRAVLEAYAISGVLGLSRRAGNRRYYDLVERLFAAELLAREVPLREQVKHKLLSRYRAHGLLGAAGSAELWLGAGWSSRPGLPTRAELREELVEDGEIVPVEVEGLRGRRFVLRDELELVASPPEPPASVAFLAPLDPLVWDRALLPTLFGFDYLWEVYVPESKRRWGYYVLPVLFRDRLVGRIEPRIDRAGKRVQVLGLWWEDGFAPRKADGFVDAMRAALRDYLGFARAGRLEWAPDLAAAKRLFLTRP
ncbi:MAG TPA: crosslink repair DNA glycosylase YcaQ family protein [Gaiellaceae bacterium]